MEAGRRAAQGRRVEPRAAPDYTLVRRLDDAAPFAVGFPSEFIEANRAWVFGAADDRVAPPRRGRP